MGETERKSTRIVAETTPSLDLVFELLSSRRRRAALYYLYEQPDGVATVEEITDSVLTSERRGDPPRDESPSVHRDDIRTDLLHVHLPKLEDAGILEHDRRTDTVRYWTQPSLEELLEHAYHKERS